VLTKKQVIDIALSLRTQAVQANVQHVSWKTWSALTNHPSS